MLHLDLPLLCTLFALISVGLVILYSASNQDTASVSHQAIRLGIALLAMLVLAQIPPNKYLLWAPWFFSLGMIMLIIVLCLGHIGKGGQRWLDLFFFRFQPSEMMKLAVPLMVAWYLHYKALPPSPLRLIIALLIILAPTLLIAKQPDLGTAVIIASAGACVILLSGVSWKFITSVLATVAAGTPVLWHFMYDYQRERVLTFFNPERDPLGSGYHIIQSKIAIGSGGLFGKGWLNGTQSHLQFLPEHATDFIFAVGAEELGLMGTLTLIVLFLSIVTRGLQISIRAQDTFTRLLAGSLTLTFFISAFVNMGMVTGILPVVGLPLPLVSYGGTSMVTLIASFGILMSIQTHRKLVTT